MRNSKNLGRVDKDERVSKGGVISLEEGVVYEGDVLERFPLIKDESIDLCFTSPPYNVGKRYGKDNGDRRDWGDYTHWSEKWVGEVYRVLKKEGFFVLNVPMTVMDFKDNRKTAIPVAPIFLEIGLRLGFEYYGSVVWDKGMILSSLFNRLKYDTTTINPPLFEGYELLLFFRKPEGKVRREGKELDLPLSELINCAWGVWTITPDIKNRSFHPAPFPYELSYRVIKLCSAKGEVVLDPFAGTETTLLSALQERRRFVGIEKERKYVDLFLKEYKLFKEKKKLLLTGS